MSWNRTFTNIRSMSNLLKNRMMIFYMLKDTFYGRYKMSNTSVFVMLICLAYLVWPLDFITDFIPIIGWIDDAFVLYFLSNRLLKEAAKWHFSYNKRSISRLN